MTLARRRARRFVVGGAPGVSPRFSRLRRDGLRLPDPRSLVAGPRSGPPLPLPRLLPEHPLVADARAERLLRPLPRALVVSVGEPLEALEEVDHVLVERGVGV